MRTQTLSRAVEDVRSVCRTASTADAARWMTSLAAHLPECAMSGSLAPADLAWARAGARFRTPTRAVVSLPAEYTAGAREMYCRNVYLRTGLTMPADYGWVIDLGANRGLFSVWAAATGATVVAVEAQQGFAPLIRDLAAYNGVADRVHVETAMAGGVTLSGAAVGVLASDSRWAGSSHGLAARPAGISMPEVMLKYGMAEVGLLKVDIEGGEFALFGTDEDLHWLSRVDQVVVEVHGRHGDAPALAGRLRDAGFGVDLRDDDGGRVTARSARLAYAYCSR
jgi:FkbM family methyltransferase